MIKAPRSAHLLERCLIHDVKLAETGYDYHGFLSRQGDYFIRRTKADGTEIRFAHDNTKTYQQAFAARATISYKYLNRI